MHSGICKKCGATFWESYKGARGEDLCDACMADDAAVLGPFDKPMRELDGVWSWLTYKGEWIGAFDSQRECEENICLHCGD